MEARADTSKIANLFSIQVSSDGFLMEAHPKLRPVDSLTDGVFIAGMVQGPKDIPDTVAQAKAAASSAANLMAKGEIEVDPYYAMVNPSLCGGCHSCIEQCPFGAISFNEDLKVAEINKIICKGCGTCVATCPIGAIDQNHFSTKQLFAILESVLGEPGKI